jgi:hypothetical protein
MPQRNKIDEECLAGCKDKTKFLTMLNSMESVEKLILSSKVEVVVILTYEYFCDKKF